MIQVERMASMGKLAAIVAHEINNPLTGILASARLLLKRLGGSTDDGDNNQAREHLELIANESSRCGEIVKNLLQFTRQTKGEYVPCDVNGLVSDSVRLVQHKIDLMRLQVKSEFAEEMPPILCDPQEIKQALVAVLINACEAMVEGEGILEVGARYRPEQRVVEVWVRDNGIGMDEQTRQQIFEPFFTTKEEGRSVGLGMAVVNGIVSRHSGRIEVTSAVGHGTTVAIQFPVSVEGRILTTQP
jgi:two-component system NtrC family sensor kinase